MFYDFITTYMEVFFFEKMREAFALQKLLSVFQLKYWCSSNIDVWNFNETLTNDVISFEQLGPDLLCKVSQLCMNLKGKLEFISRSCKQLLHPENKNGECPTSAPSLRTWHFGQRLLFPFFMILTTVLCKTVAIHHFIFGVADFRIAFFHS